jgi:hypothetical protein
MNETIKTGCGASLLKRTVHMLQAGYLVVLIDTRKNIIIFTVTIVQLLVICEFVMFKGIDETVAVT